MTFFNKKTEVMQIELTPYGRYLYSIGKFKPHSYEFVDDDILYKASGSTEAQEDIHQRIINETPKLKINRAFQDEAPQVQAPSRIQSKRVMQKKMTQKQNSLQALGKSSYSSDNMPSFQVTMLQGKIEDSKPYKDEVSSIFIPQVDINFDVEAKLKNELEEPSVGKMLISKTFDDGRYVELSYKEPIIHLKEFNSFYEKENFEIEVFEILDAGVLSPLKMPKITQKIVNDLLVFSTNGSARDEGDLFFDENEYVDNKNLAYFFDIEVDSEIPQEDLCKVIENLEINSQFLDEELICPDQRTERFDIYSTRVGPQDLEDCDD